MSEWMPIESAPKNGVWLLLFGRTYRTNAKHMVCRWDGSEWESTDDGYGVYIMPTHWCFLPTPPETKP